MNRNDIFKFNFAKMSEEAETKQSEAVDHLTFQIMLEGETKIEYLTKLHSPFLDEHKQSK